MTVNIAYGRSGLDITIDDAWSPVVVRGRQAVAVPDPQAAVVAALRRPLATPPLRDLAAGALRGRAPQVGVVFNDITRATPHALLLPPILDELRAAGIADDRIVLFNATGTHRPNTPDELVRILGTDIAGRFEVVQNDCEASAEHREIGVTRSGNRVRVLTRFLDCDLRIATGFIEPHFFAGFSGGGKAVVPGLAHLSTILHNHGPQNLDHADAGWGVTGGNPLWEDLAAAAAFAEPLFLVNVTMNAAQQITGVFAGDRATAHAAGCREVAAHAVVPVDRRFDIVVSCNSGYPLDLNLYQAVKGMSAAARVVRPGGRIVLAAECWDGVPAHGLFAQMLSEAPSAAALLARLRLPQYQVRDAWQAHILARVASNARITVVSPALQRLGVCSALFDLAQSVESALAETAGCPSICVLPDGPLTIPTLDPAGDSRRQPDNASSGFR